MQDEQISLAPWTASPGQLWAVRMRAKCFTQQQIADTLEVDWRTVARWCAIPEFQAAVAELQDEMMERFDADFDRLIQKAVRIEDLAMDGDIPANDPRAILAHDTVKSVVYPLVRRRIRDGAVSPPVDAEPPKQLPDPAA